MPIGRFTQCMAGDLPKVAKGRFYHEAKAKVAWMKLFDQHIKEHGLPPVYVEYVEKMKKAITFYEQAYHGKKWQIVRARVYEAEAKQMIVGEGEKIEKTCARISKFMGFPVRPNECSVSEFYNYIEIMSS